MEEKIYKVKKIEGEYAFIEPLDGAEELFIAMALLPPGVNIGSLIKYENFQFANLE